MKEKQKNRPAPSRGEEEMLASLEEKIGYAFKNREVLRSALTHTSYANEHKAKKVEISSNERLEFLGDSILSLVTAEYLYKRMAGSDEGDLTRLRALAVCEDALFDYAREVGLGGCLYLGHGEEISLGRERKSILADAFEAVIGAVYVDSGMEKARAFVLRFAKPRIEEHINSASTVDYKTLLQTFIQRSPGEVLEYNLIGQDGPEHDRLFVMQAVLNGNPIGRGEGRAKRQAEQQAAKQALELFGICPGK